MLDAEVIKLARILWDYHKLDQSVAKADLIFGLGSMDLRVADRAAELYKENYAPLVLFSGGIAHSEDLLRTTWDKPEAEVFAERAIELGVPEVAIMTELTATNTGENIQFGFELLQSRDIDVQSVILVQKPYMERRTYATFMKQWPGREVDIKVTSPQLSFAEYILAEGFPQQEKIINIMVGDLQRIKEYPMRDFQIEQEIPSEVWSAFERLVELGFDKHLFK